MNQYNLESRTFEFSKNLIDTIRTIKVSLYSESIIKQLIRSGTSVGANYREANGAESKKDFKHKISISLKEARETKYWLELLLVSNPESHEKLNPLQKEIYELTLIFGKINSSCK